MTKARKESAAPEPVEQPAASEAAVTDAAAREAELLEKVADLEQQLEKANAKANEYSDGWQRERADFSNYKKRVEREQAQLTQNLAGNILKKYLPVMDDLERALKARPAQGDGAAWAEGVELVYRKLEKVLEGEGLQRMQAENEFFDPTRHEAISNEDHPEVESGRIIEVVQPGYVIGDRVLRPALVRVAR